MTTRRMSVPSAARHGRLGLASALALALAACGPAIDGRNPGLGWSEAGSPKELEVERAQYRHAVYFDTDRTELKARERDELLTFLRTVNLEPGDSIRIEGHADERASDLYNLDLAARRAEAVKDFLRAQGLGRVEVHQSAYGERVPAAPGSSEEAWRQNRRVEVVVERHLVVLPPCPDWSRRSGTDFANEPHTNFGCAVRTNLGLMVAEPRDLERGRGLGPADGVREAEAIARYRRGEVIELEEEALE